MKRPHNYRARQARKTNKTKRREKFTVHRVKYAVDIETFDSMVHSLIYRFTKEASNVKEPL